MTVLNVQTDYGAAGDGSTDDTVAIQSAIDDAGPGDTIYLPAGTYVVAKTNAVDNEACVMFDSARGNGVSDVEMVGDKANTTIRLSDGNANFVKVIGVDCTSTITGLVLRNFVVDGNRTNQASGARGQNIGIADEGANDNDITVSNVKSVSALDTGIAPRAGGVTVEDCTVIDAGKHGIGLGHPSGRVVVRRCLAKRNSPGEPTYNLDFSNGSGLVEDCVFNESGGSGFKTTEDVGDVTYRRVRSENNTLSGYMYTGTGGSPNATMEDVVIRNNGENGLRFANELSTNVPSGSDVVSVGNNKMGLLLSGQTSVSFDGTFHSTNNKRTLYADGESSGYLSDVQQSGNEYSDLKTGGVTVQSVGGSPKTDLGNVPTESEVGAFNGSSTSGSTEETFATDFSGATVGSQPGNWTQAWGSSAGDFTSTDSGSVVGGKRLELSASTGARRALQWTTPTETANAEVHGLVTVPSYDDTLDDHCRLYARGSGSSGGETAYFFSLMKNQFAIRSYANGDLTTHWTGGSPTAGTKYRVRFRVTDSTLKVKVWEDGSSEPSSWDGSVTDGQITGTGWVGVGGYSNAAQYWDAVTVGTAGATAPSIAESSSGDGVSGSISTSVGSIQTL